MIGRSAGRAISRLNAGPGRIAAASPRTPLSRNHFLGVSRAGESDWWNGERKHFMNSATQPFYSAAFAPTNHLGDAVKPVKQTGVAAIPIIGGLAAVARTVTGVFPYIRSMGKKQQLQPDSRLLVVDKLKAIDNARATPTYPVHGFPTYTGYHDDSYRRGYGVGRPGEPVPKGMPQPK